MYRSKQTETSKTNINSPTFKKSLKNLIKEKPSTNPVNFNIHTALNAQVNNVITNTIFKFFVLFTL